MKCAVLTISDLGYMGMRRDESGPAVKARLEEEEAKVAPVEILPDERDQIAAKLRDLADNSEVDVIFTTGGTGAALRDVTPEATRDVIEREMPGLGERMRSAGAAITPLAYLSRSVAGIRGKTLIVNLPGSPKGAVESLDAILDLLPHIVRLLHGSTAH